MIFFVSMPFWLGLAIWLWTTPSRNAAQRRAERAAAEAHELQMIAAMPDAIKEEYWRNRREAEEAKAAIREAEAAKREAEAAQAAWEAANPIRIGRTMLLLLTPSIAIILFAVLVSIGTH